MPSDPYQTDGQHNALLNALLPDGGGRWDALGIALTATLAGLDEWEFIAVSGFTAHRNGRPALVQVRLEPEGLSLETRANPMLPAESPLTSAQEITLTRIGLTEDPPIGMWSTLCREPGTAAAIAVDILTEVWAVPDPGLVRLEAAGWAPEPAPVAPTRETGHQGPPDVTLLLAAVDALWVTL